MEKGSDRKDLDKKNKKSFSDKVLNKSQKSIDRFGKLSIVLASVFLVILISVSVVLTVGSKFGSSTTQDSNDTNSTNSTQNYSNPTTNNSNNSNNQDVNNTQNSTNNNSVNKNVYSSGSQRNNNNSSESDNLNQ